MTELGAALADFRQLLGRGAATLGVASCCYVRAAVGVAPGAMPAWRYTLVPLALQDSPSPIWLTPGGPQAGTASAQITISQNGPQLILRLRLTSPASQNELQFPAIDFVLCTEGSVLADVGDAPPRLGGALLGVSAARVRALPTSYTATVTLMVGDPGTSRVRLRLETPASAPLRAAAMDAVPGRADAHLEPAALAATASQELIQRLAGRRRVSIRTLSPGAGSDGFEAGIELSQAGHARDFELDVMAGWAPPPRPAAVATSRSSNNTDPVFRYAVAMVTATAESPPGARSNWVRCPPGGRIQLRTPPPPVDPPGIVAWRVFRSRFDGAEWGPWLRAADTPPGTTIEDTPPAADPRDAVQGLGSRLRIGFGARETWVSANTATWDSDLAALTARQQPAQMLTAAATVGSGALDWRPARYPAASTLTWPGQGNADRSLGLQAVMRRPLSGTSFTLDPMQLPARFELRLSMRHLEELWWASWDAASSLTARFSAELPRARLFVTQLRVEQVPAQFLIAGKLPREQETLTAVGWDAGAASGAVRVQVRQLPEPPASSTTPTWTDLLIPRLPIRLALTLDLPAEGAPAGAPMAIAFGDWAPSAPRREGVSTLPLVRGALQNPLERLVLHRRPSAELRPRRAEVGPGPPVAVDVGLTDDGLEALRVQADAVREVSLATPPWPSGPDSTMRVLVDRAGPAAAARLQVTKRSNADDATHHVRAARLGRLLLDLITQPSQLGVALLPGSEPLERLRVWSDGGGTPAASRERIGTHTVGTAKVVELDLVLPGSSFDLSGIQAEGAGGPLRVVAQVPRGERPHARFRFCQSDAQPMAKLPLLDAEASVSGTLSLVIGDGGIVGVETRLEEGRLHLVDSLARFHRAWRGRRVRVEGWEQTGRIVGISSASELVIVPPVGASAPAPGSWYLIRDRDGDFGIRLRGTGAPLRGRVAAAMLRGQRLAGIKANPQVRIIKEPRPGGQAADMAAASVRVAAVTGATFSSWSPTAPGPGDEPYPEPESLLLVEGRGGFDFPAEEPPPTPDRVQVPDPNEVAIPAQPTPPSWLLTDVSFDASRVNSSLLAVINQRTPQACLSGRDPAFDRGIDELHLSLRSLPRQIAVLQGPAGAAIAAEGARATIRSEGLLRRPDGAEDERGFGSVEIELLPPFLTMAGGWRQLREGPVDVGETISLAGRTPLRWQRDATRVVAVGGPLHLGRSVSLRYDGPVEPFTDDKKMKWAGSDIWWFRLIPDDEAGAEAVLSTPHVAWAGKDAALELVVSGGQLTARIISVGAGEHSPSECRRVGRDQLILNRLGIEAEIQIEGFTGMYTLNPVAWAPPFDTGQRYQLDRGALWLCAYSRVPGLLGIGISNGYFGTTGGSVDWRPPLYRPHWA